MRGALPPLGVLRAPAPTTSRVQPQSAGSNKEEKGRKGKKGKTKESTVKKQQQKPKSGHRGAGGGKEVFPGGVLLHESQDPALEEQQDEKVSGVLASPCVSAPSPTLMTFLVLRGAALAAFGALMENGVPDATTLGARWFQAAAQSPAAVCVHAGFPAQPKRGLGSSSPGCPGSR